MFAFAFVVNAVEEWEAREESMVSLLYDAAAVAADAVGRSRKVHLHSHIAMRAGVRTGACGAGQVSVESLIAAHRQPRAACS